MSMISELVDRLRVESKSMGKYGVDYMSTLLMEASDTIMMLSEKARADRPKGHWETYKDEHLCSVCKGYVTGEWYYEDDAYDYCPWCGALMEGADDD